MSKPSSGLCKGTMGDRNSSVDTGGVISQLPTNDAQLKHIFRVADGHLPYSAENLQLIKKVANDPSKYVGNDKYGNQWYSEIQPDGSQI